MSLQHGRHEIAARDPRADAARRADRPCARRPGGGACAAPRAGAAPRGRRRSRCSSPARASPCRSRAPTEPRRRLRRCAAVPAALRAEPVLNDYGFGGYLIGAEVRPFIDGRADMYGDAFLDLYGKIVGGDSDALEPTLKRYAIAWTIFAPSERDRRADRPRTRLAAALRGQVRGGARARRSGGVRADRGVARGLIAIAFERLAQSRAWPSIHDGGGAFDGSYTSRPDLSLRCVHKPPPSRTGLTPMCITIIYINV